MTDLRRAKWLTPAFCVAMGGASLAALWAGGRAGDGIAVFALLVAFGALVLLGGRSELVRGLRGDGRDEYWARLDVRAGVVAGYALLAAVLAMCLWEWSHGRDGTPYIQLGALAGVAYLAAVGLFRWRG